MESASAAKSGADERTGKLGASPPGRPRLSAHKARRFDRSPGGLVVLEPAAVSKRRRGETDSRPASMDARRTARSDRASAGSDPTVLYHNLPLRPAPLAYFPF